MTDTAPALVAAPRKATTSFATSPARSGCASSSTACGSPIPRARSSCTKRAPRRCTTFPSRTCRMDMLERTTHQTHCPFKGNASYWSLKVGDKVAENAVWSYEEPYRDAEPIRGYLSFYRNKISALYEGDEEVAFLHKRGDAVHGNPIAAWLIEEAWKARSPEALMARVLRLPARCRLSASRAPPSSFRRCIRRSSRPCSSGATMSPDVRVVFEPHDILLQPALRRQPVRADHPRRRRRAPAPRGRRTSSSIFPSSATSRPTAPPTTSRCRSAFPTARSTSCR